MNKSEGFPLPNIQAKLLPYLGAGAVGIFSTGLSVSGAQARDVYPNREVALAAQKLTEKVHHKDKVPVAANDTILWTTLGSKFRYQYSTPEPIREKVDGSEHYFRTIVRKDCTPTLADVVVVPIPPSEIQGVYPGPLVFHKAGEKEKRVITRDVIVSLDKQHLPVADFYFNVGARVLAEVGVTNTLNANTISD